MSWIKRNLFFVAGVVVGVLLMVAAGYYLYGNLEENGRLTEDFKTALSELQNIRNKSPYPSQENIESAKQQQQEMREFVRDFKGLFGPFSVPAIQDEKTFGTYLSRTISGLQNSAAEAGVAITPGYSFSFSAIYSTNRSRVSFPKESIGPWCEQMEEIKTLCGILYRSQINALEGIRRVPVSPDDRSTADRVTTDYLPTTSITNQVGVVTPYEISFRGFSKEIAAVLDGLLRATNCFIVKNVNVEPSKFSVGPVTATSQAAYQPMVAPPAPVSRLPREFTDRYGPPEAGGGSPAAPRPAAPTFVYRPSLSAASGLMTILSERPLHVTLSIDVVKPKNSP